MALKTKKGSLFGDTKKEPQEEEDIRGAERGEDEPEDEPYRVFETEAEFKEAVRKEMQKMNGGYDEPAGRYGRAGYDKNRPNGYGENTGGYGRHGYGENAGGYGRYGYGENAGGYGRPGYGENGGSYGRYGYGEPGRGYGANGMDSQKSGAIVEAWRRDARALKEIVPEFELAEAIREPEFTDILRRGGSILEAYAAISRLPKQPERDAIYQNAHMAQRGTGEATRNPAKLSPEDFKDYIANIKNR